MAPYPFDADEYVEYMDYRMNGFVYYSLGLLFAVACFAKSVSTMVITTQPGGLFGMHFVGWGPVPWAFLSTLGVAFAVRGSAHFERAHRFKQSREAWAVGRTAFLTMTARVILKFIKTAQEADSDD